MDRRKFFKNGALFSLGTALINPMDIIASPTQNDAFEANKKAKNIIMLVSDGMSSGTLNMADHFLNRKYGRRSNWITYYQENKVNRALMETASLNSIVTDSSAGSSSWGGGFRVNNGSINVAPDGTPHLPIWQKFKKAGKMAGCVTTVPITHATPAGYTAISGKRSDMEGIAEQYLEQQYDIMMGGGNKYFAADKRKDKKDMYAAFSKKGYQVVRNRNEMLAADPKKPILGVYGEEDMPYRVDRINQDDLSSAYPTLGEMTQKAIDRMKDHKNGFVLHVESGKTDWAAHANDIAGLIHEQIAFDEALKVAMDFAEKDKNTLVIFTTDHGNANPGIIYGKNADTNFDSIQKYNRTNEFILNQITNTSSVKEIKDIIKEYNSIDLLEEDAKYLQTFYNGLHKKEDGLYNYKKLPYKAYCDIQQRYNNVGWISMDHSADHVECAIYGPGSELLKPFIKNTDLHYLMLQAAEVENKF
ncbi:MAG: alkaline phosphatase [Flavobacterium sp.]|nr:alkaline phosphatase [Candidatus Neoflavobacterium equi]